MTMVIRVRRVTGVMMVITDVKVPEATVVRKVTVVN